MPHRAGEGGATPRPPRSVGRRALDLGPGAQQEHRARQARGPCGWGLCSHDDRLPKRAERSGESLRRTPGLGGSERR